MSKQPNYPQPVSDPDALPKNYDPREAEARWQQYWADCGVYDFEPYVEDPGGAAVPGRQGDGAHVYPLHQEEAGAEARPTRRLRTREEIFSIDTPPPTVSGKLHIGHVYSYTQTDMNARYQRMRGKHVFYPFGFDDNGLPTERLVETVTGKRANDVIAESGREAFIELCKPIVEGAEQEFIALWKSLALSCDWSQFYTTIDERSRAISQASFIDLYNRGYIYRKVAPTQWDWVNQTAIAQAEIEDREVPGHFHDIRFGWADGPGAPLQGHLTIATTRPELIPACVAVFAHPDDERYKHLFGKVAVTPLFEVEVPILPSEKANPEKGTGILMCCTFGDMDDVEHWKEHHLPLRIIIGKDGKILDFAKNLPSRNNEAVQAFGEQMSGLKVKAAREAIRDLLGMKDILLGVKDIMHTVRHAERGDVPVEILVTPQWYVNILDHKDALIEQGRKINWHPEYMRKRYEQWVEGLNTDWCISRQRYNGVPFPVWYDGAGNPVLADPAQLPVNPLIDAPSSGGAPAAALLTDEQVHQALKLQHESGQRLSEVIVELGFVTDDEVAGTLAAHLGIEAMDLSRAVIDPQTAGLIEPEQAARLLVLPVSREGDAVIVAMVDPLDLASIDELRQTLGCNVIPAITSPAGLNSALRRIYGGTVAATTLTPDPDVMDTWATSSTTPLLNTQLVIDRQPDGSVLPTELFTQLFPFDMRPQAHDIIRTWAFYTIAKAYFHFGEIPWKDIVISGHAQDAGGKKISKSRGHVVTPAEMVEKYSADGLRYWSGSVRLGTDTLYDERNLTEGRKLINKIFNATKFALRHLLDFDPASKEGFSGAGAPARDLPAPDKPPLLREENGGHGGPPHWNLTDAIVYPTDLWLLGRLNDTIERATRANDAFEFGEAKQAAEDFFWADLCDNYLELSKGRLYGEPLAVEAHAASSGGGIVPPSDSEGEHGGGSPPPLSASHTAEQLRRSAQATLHIALSSVLRLFAPVLPHITEECWSWHFARFSDKRSIHEEAWPSSATVPGRDQPDGASRDACATEFHAAALLLHAVAAVRKWKSEHNVSVKKPLAMLSIYLTEHAPKDAAGEHLLSGEHLHAVLGDLMSTCNARQAFMVAGDPPGGAVTTERSWVAVTCEMADEGVDSKQ